MDRPARTFVLPVPPSRMVSPYAAISKNTAGHRHRKSYTGYQRHRGPELEASRAVRTRGHVPSDDAASKLLYLVLNHAAADWKRPPREWLEAKTQFAVIFKERFVLA